VTTCYFCGLVLGEKNTFRVLTYNEQNIIEVDACKRCAKKHQSDVKKQEKKVK